MPEYALHGICAIPVPSVNLHRCCLGQTFKSIGLHTSGWGNYLPSKTTSATMIYGMEGTLPDSQSQVLISQPRRKVFVSKTKIWEGCMFYRYMEHPTLFLCCFLEHDMVLNVYVAQIYLENFNIFGIIYLIKLYIWIFLIRCTFKLKY